MRTATTFRATLAIIVTGGMLAIPAMATAADTTVSFTVAAAGTLAVSQAGSTATLTDGAGALDFSATLPGTVSGTLPTTTVTDTRGTLVAPWTVSVVATGDFLNAADNAITVPRTGARAYMDATNVAGMTTALGGALNGMVLTGGAFTAVGAENLSSSYTLLSGTSTLGNGSVAYTPSVTVTVPAGTPAGTYSATVQQTVS